MSLQRSGPPERRTGLARRTELRATGWAPVSDALSRSGPTRKTSLSSRPSAAQRRHLVTWSVVRAQAWEAWDQQCAVGGHPLPWEQCMGHHRLMRSHQGPDTVANCLPVCMAHHDYVHGLGNAAYEAGWLVRNGLDPDEVPVIGGPVPLL